MKVVHDWLKDYVGDALPSAEKVEELLTFHSFEIEGLEKNGEQKVIDVDVLPNRAADCLSHRGIARELATLLDTKLEHDPLREKPDMPETDQLKITIGDSNACRHFDLALISGVTVKDSPAWLKARLESLGQRSINNIVDATNYVMFALGQPTHVYDASKFKKDGEQWHFGTRMGKVGEKVATLGGEEYEVDETIQLITNEADGSYAGIAGIKGGAYAELTSETTEIIIEAANFEPSLTRKASQKLRLQTDASKRFENSISTNVIPFAINEVVQLILNIAGGELVGYAHERPVEITNQPVDVTLKQTNDLLGLDLKSSDVENIFVRLGFEFDTKSDDSWQVTAPFERNDINIAEDVIEEIGRVHGYDKVVSVVPSSVALTEYNRRHYYSEKLRDVLVGLGFSEVITSSFRKKDTIQLQNALASDKTCLRSSLIKNVTEALDKNATLTDILGTADTRIFEIGTVFSKTPDSVTENVVLGLGVRLRPSGYTGKEDALLNDVLKSLSTELGLALDPVIEKGVAEINVTELLEKLPAISEYEPVSVAEDTAYQAYSTFPSISRDIALWVTDGISAADVQAVLDNHAGDLRVRTRLFDEFSKDGRTSFAFRLVFQAMDKTLTDEEVNGYMDAVYKAVAEKDWEVR